MRGRIYSILFIVAGLWTFGCNNNCPTELDIEISSHLRSTESYCTLLKRSLHGDRVSLRQFYLIINQGTYAYEHGIILVHLINYIGYEESLSVIPQMKKSEISILKGYLIAGEEYGDVTLNNRKEVYSALEVVYSRGSADNIPN